MNYLAELRQKVIYRKIKSIASTRYYDGTHKRHICDLERGYLFYFPETGKISTTLKGCVFSLKNGKLRCFYTIDELKELLTQIEK